MKHEQIMNTGYAAACPKRCHRNLRRVSVIVVEVVVCSLLFDGVKVAADILVHLEHVHLGLLEDCMHLVVAYDLSFVLWVLEIVGFDVFPKLLDHLRPGQLLMY
jgi:hypothetical protein